MAPTLSWIKLAHCLPPSRYIANTDFKYLRCLGAFYLRLVGTAMDCYTYLEPILKDFRKIKRMKRDGGFELIHVDEFIDELLTEERVCDIILPRISVSPPPCLHRWSSPLLTRTQPNLPEPLCS